MSTVKHRVDVAEKQTAAIALAYIAQRYGLTEEELEPLKQFKQEVTHYYQSEDGFLVFVTACRKELTLASESSDSVETEKKILEVLANTGLDQDGLHRARINVFKSVDIAEVKTIEDLLAIDRRIYEAAEKANETA